MNALSQLYIRETHTFEGIVRRDEFEGGVHEDYCKTIITQNNKKYGFFLCSKYYFYVHKQDNKNWALNGFNRFDNAPHAYVATKANIIKSLPKAFSLPFSIPLGSLTVTDILEGNTLFTGVGSGGKTVVDKIVAVQIDGLPSYRIDFSCIRQSDSKTYFSGYIVITPGYSWMITRGRLHEASEEWSISYGNSVNGIHAPKMIVINKTDRTTGQKIKDSAKIIEVNEAKIYNVVNEAEYSLDYYGLSEPAGDLLSDPSKEIELPIGIFIGIGGVLCFIIGILLIARTARRGRASRSTAPV